jgi:hypothetical protein
MFSAFLGVIIFLVGMTLGILAFLNRGHGKPWFYWIAPLLAFGFALMMLQLVIGYWMKVGRLETKGRRRSE